MVAAIVGMAAAATMPVIQKLVLDDVVIHHNRTLATLLLAFAGLGLVRFVATVVRRYIGGRVSLDVSFDLRNAIFDHLQQLDFASHDELQSGQLVSRANADLGMVQGLLAWLPLVLGNIVQLGLALGFMAWLSPPLCGVTVVVVLATFAAAWRMRSVVYVSTWDANQREAEMTATVEEAVSGVRVVKGFGQEERELSRLVDATELMFGARVRNLRERSKFTALLQTLPALGQLSVLLLGGWLALEGHLTVGTLLAFFTYLTQLAAPARVMAVFLTAAQQARAGTERVMELLDTAPRVHDEPDARDLDEVAGHITFDHVTFGYLRGSPILDDFTLDIAAGERVALVGASGSGKSTAGLLVPRFYDAQRGAVRIDGVDVRELRLTSLRSQIGVVFEESFLFSDPVRQNIAYGRPDATDEQIVAAARAAEADEFVNALPDGYDTVVGERGLTLSGGQRQRLTLARALLTDPQILILDDATSSVDARVEEEIHATLERLMPGRTTLLIAHRRSTLRLAHRIVVVDGGKVLDSGTHEELTARCERYRELLSGPQDLLAEDVAAAGHRDDERAEQALANGHAAPDEGIGAPTPSTAASADGKVAMAANRFATRPAPTGRGGVVGRGGMGGGGMGGGGRGGGTGARWLGPATPELLAAIEALPPAPDHSNVDPAREAVDRGGLHLRRFLRAWRPELALGLLLVVLDAMATLAGPTLVKIGIDRGVARGSLSVLVALSIVYLAVTLFDWWDMWAENLVTGRTAERVLMALRIRVFAHLQRLGLDFYEREMAGRLLTRMTSDVDTLSNLISNGLINAVVNGVTFLGMAIVLVVLSPPLTLAVICLVPPLVVATAWFRRRSSVAYDKQRDRIAAVNADLQENLSGVREVQAFQREARNADHFRDLGSQHLDAGLEAMWIQARYFGFVELLSTVGTIAVLGIGTGLTHSGTITVGVLVAFLLYLTQFFAPIQQLSQVFDTWQTAGAGMRKLDGLLTTPTTVPTPSHPETLPQLTAELRFDHVRFRYPEQREWALDDVDLTIAAGERVALVGETGSGKSTFVKLVARFHDPTAGRVLVDGIDLATVDPGIYRRHLGYVPQEPFLFAASVRDNIAYGRPDATDAQVVAAARAVGVHDRIERLPGGYEHVLLERGRSLSTGERQLLCMARALVVDPAILLLDEATSNLDLASEARIAHALEVVAADRTTILIAHRLPSARRATRILVLDGGHVVADGRHADLLARPGRYRELWEAFEGEAAPVAS